MKQRLAWIDFLRGIAVLGMIETHVVNTFLTPFARIGNGFALLSYLNGLVAPTFLFVSGLLQGLWLRKHCATHSSLAPKWKSIALLFLIGYGLQFPWDAMLDTEKIFASFGRVDILHCIAGSLAITLLLTRFSRSETRNDILLLVLLNIIVIAAPYVWNSIANSANSTSPWVGYVGKQNGALFPLIPWSAFLFSGVLVSRWISNVRILGVLSLITYALGWILKALLKNAFELQTYEIRSDFFFFRLSFVLLACAVCAQVLQSQKSGPITRAITWCGSRSLLLYVWHLILLYGGIGILPPLHKLFSRTQNATGVVGLFFLTLASTLALTWAWQWTASRILVARKKQGIGCP